MTTTMQRLPQTTALMGVILSLLLLLTGLPAAAERTVTYFHSDAAGSVVAASNAAGDLLWRKHYAPYGQQLGGSDTTEPTAYAGHVHDQDIGLTYMKARYYDPEAGRFMGVDPAGVSESNPLSFNRYAYANNNPYKYVDPDGRVGKLINGGIKLIKHGGNPKKAGKEFIADVADSVTTLVDPSASAVDKGLAAFDLVSPVGTQDIKKLADATKGRKDRIQVKDITNPGAKSPNFQIDKTRSQFEKHLTDNGFDKKSVSTPKGDINIFSKNGKKEFTTRGFSKSTEGPSGEIFTGGKKVAAKIRFKEE